MYITRIFHKLNNDIKTLKTRIELIDFVRLIADENDDQDMPIDSVRQAKDYINTYSDNLFLIPEAGTKVILEFYMEMWFCYKDGESMNTSLFTCPIYDEIVATCEECELNIIQTIDMSYLADEKDF